MLSLAILWALSCLVRVGSHIEMADSATVARKTRAYVSASRGPIHVCLCSDDTDLRPAAVTIRSVFESASQPERVHFHFITTQEFAPLADELFRTHVPAAHVEVHHNKPLQWKIRATISFRKTSKARESLASPFNFAPFYLDQFIAGQQKTVSRNEDNGLHRLIYLDTDTVILGDIVELHDMNLLGHPCAAVKYCLQRYDDYIDFAKLESMGLGAGMDPKTCIANRGVLVIDVDRWKQVNLTGKIEQWMVYYRQADGDLWYGGMSQPPWLLAMHNDYKELGEEWNCNSLGRDAMSRPESHNLRQSGFTHKALRRLGLKFSEFGHILPYLVTCSAKAKLLHYNGAIKPWLAEKYMNESMPVCALPDSMLSQPFVSKRTVRVSCTPQLFVNCSELWSKYISTAANCALKDFDKEWTDEERMWKHQERDDRGQWEVDRKDREKKEQEDRLKEGKRMRARAERRSKKRAEERRQEWNQKFATTSTVVGKPAAQVGASNDVPPEKLAAVKSDLASLSKQSADNDVQTQSGKLETGEESIEALEKELKDLKEDIDETDEDDELDEADEKDDKRDGDIIEDMEMKKADNDMTNEENRDNDADQKPLDQNAFWEMKKALTEESLLDNR